MAGVACGAGDAYYSGPVSPPVYPEGLRVYIICASYTFVHLAGVAFGAGDAYYPGPVSPPVYSEVSVCESCHYHNPPEKALQLGYQTDGGGEHWIGVAKTEWGTIPGKAKDGTCWYAYGGEEHYTNDFCWVVSQKSTKLVKNEGNVPELAIQCGYQTDGAGYLYAAIANTEWGRIPGKAQNGTCWYPYGGKEHYTSDFDWVVSD